MKNVDIRNKVVWFKMADGRMKPFFVPIMLLLPFLRTHTITNS